MTVSTCAHFFVGAFAWGHARGEKKDQAGDGEKDSQETEAEGPLDKLARV